MEVRIKFSADVYIKGKNMAEIKSKFEELPLWSDEAKECGAEFNELLLVDDAKTYEDLRNKYNKV